MQHEIQTKKRAAEGAGYDFFVCLREGGMRGPDNPLLLLFLSKFT
jgi:hypothetical protein